MRVCFFFFLPLFFSLFQAHSALKNNEARKKNTEVKGLFFWIYFDLNNNETIVLGDRNIYKVCNSKYLHR